MAGAARALLAWVQTLQWHEFFVANSLLSVVSFIPGLAGGLATAAGVLYGIVAGTILYSVSATVGALICFTIARYGPRAYLQRVLASSPFMQVLCSPRVAQEGLKLTFLLRLSPITPFVACSFLLGLSSVSFSTYLVGTLAGLLPASFVFVYVGAIGQMAGNMENDESTRGQMAMQAVGLLATVLVTYKVVRVAQSTLEELKSKSACTTPQANFKGDKQP